MIKTVAVGTDGSDTAAKAVEFALDLASRYEAKIVFLSAYRAVSEDRLKRESRDAPEDVQWQINPAEDVEPALRDAEDEARERGLDTTSEAKEGDASKVLVELADKHSADVLVIGNKGMKRKVLGSVPNTVSHNAGCSVLIVKTTYAAPRTPRAGAPYASTPRRRQPVPSAPSSSSTPAPATPAVISRCSGRVPICEPRSS